jgi:cobalt-zinc-cadmium resistance protein CzcA
MPIDGVTEVLAFGGNVKQYQVQLDPNKLLSYQLHTGDINRYGYVYWCC